MSLTDDQIAAIQATLPDGIDPDRLEWLRPLLDDWFSLSLPEIRMHSTAAENTARRAAILGVFEAAVNLNLALTKLDDISFGLIAVQMEPRENFVVKQARGAEGQAWVKKLALVTEGGVVPANPKGRQPKPINYLILRDLAAVYKVVSGREATREISRDDVEPIGRFYGKLTGPFYRFTKIIWDLVYPDDTESLDSAMKLWSRDRKLYDEPSAFIANFRMRHGI